jgi:flagella basal body P-ring formation protein FlgA
VLGVARGEWALLRALAGAVRLESRVEVLQDGRLGDKVRVRTPGAMGTVFATVVGPHQLELAR